jgi:hypothetical protein
MIPPVLLTAWVAAQGVAVEHRNEGSNIAQFCFGLRFGERGKWSGGETAGTEPERNDRRRTAGGKPADYSVSGMPLVTSALCCGRNRRGREGHRADRQPVMEQESALVTAVIKFRFPEQKISGICITGVGRR